MIARSHFHVLYHEGLTLRDHEFCSTLELRDLNAGVLKDLEEIFNVDPSSQNFRWTRFKRYFSWRFFEPLVLVFVGLNLLASPRVSLQSMMRHGV